jgi:hypothetical protein
LVPLRAEEGEQAALYRTVHLLQGKQVRPVGHNLGGHPRETSDPPIQSALGTQEIVVRPVLFLLLVVVVVVVVLLLLPGVLGVLGVLVLVRCRREVICATRQRPTDYTSSAVPGALSLRLCPSLRQAGSKDVELHDPENAPVAAL